MKHFIMAAIVAGSWWDPSVAVGQGPQREPNEEQIIQEVVVAGGPREALARTTRAKVTSDPVVLADRINIINTVTSYPHTLDEGRYDDWLDLFTDDTVMKGVVPGDELLVVSGKEAVAVMAGVRRAGRPADLQRRHAISTVNVVEQSADSAYVRAYMQISTAGTRDGMKVVTSGTYHFWLSRQADGDWRIGNWEIHTDMPVSPVQVPKDIRDRVQGGVDLQTEG